jgi:hypothetical protein
MEDGLVVYRYVIGSDKLNHTLEINMFIYRK